MRTPRPSACGSKTPDRLGHPRGGEAVSQRAVATRIETNVVYAPGLVQGIVVVTLPAASTIFTDPNEYLSSSKYGAMFLPQVITAIAGALLGAGLTPSRVEARLPRRVDREPGLDGPARGECA